MKIRRSPEGKGGGVPEGCCHKLRIWAFHQLFDARSIHHKRQADPTLVIYDDRGRGLLKNVVGRRKRGREPQNSNGLGVDLLDGQ